MGESWWKDIWRLKSLMLGVAWSRLSQDRTAGYLGNAAFLRVVDEVGCSSLKKSRPYALEKGKRNDEQLRVVWNKCGDSKSDAWRCLVKATAWPGPFTPGWFGGTVSSRLQRNVYEQSEAIYSADIRHGVDCAQLIMSRPPCKCSTHWERVSSRYYAYSTCMSQTVFRVT